LEVWRLLAHNHWFTLNMYGHQVRLCARCSGYLLGFVALLLIPDDLSDILGLNNVGIQWPVFFLLAFPLILDWITQSWGLRTSTNYVRFVTGSLMGMDVFLFSKISLSLQTGRYMFVCAALIVVLIGLLGRLRDSSVSMR